MVVVHSTHHTMQRSDAADNLCKIRASECNAKENIFIEIISNLFMHRKFESKP